MGKKTTRTRPASEKARQIINRMARRGAVRSATVQKAVLKAGVSLRTYRAVRRSMGVIAVRRSRHGGRRGAGTWFTKAR